MKNQYHGARAMLANILFGFPAKDLIVIGVTGTDGKTTTSSIIYNILKEKGEKVALISTLGAQMGGKMYETGFHTTTPSSFYLQKYFKKIKEEGCKYVVLEVTSQGLDQNRVLGIPFKIGILTNVTHDHLDYHKTYKNYLNAKLKLLKKSEVCIVNMDDQSYKFLNSELKNKKTLTYSLNNKDADFNLEKFSFKTNLMGDFNKRNCLAAIAVAKMLNIKDEYIKKAILTFSSPEGRQDIVYDKDFKIVIDFAHTPYAFEQILPTVAKVKKGRLIHVFGTAGERDKSKRPIMGRISASYADVIVLTAEDPRSESIDKIFAEIENGILDIESNVNPKIEVYKIPNRQEAINYAVKIAKKGDLVLITGKGHEKSLNLGHGEESWSEYDAVKKAIKLRFNKD